MATEVIMPALNPGQETGIFLEWLKQEGDSIEDVLNYVKYDVELISKQLQDRCISADVSDEDRKQFEKWLVQSLKNYVYLK